MNGKEKHFYQFKSFRLNVEEQQLLNDNSPVPLTPKAFDVLAVLVKRGGHLIERDELLNLVWADSFVEEQNITRIIHTLRKTLGEDENGNKFIETVAKKGYRFVAKVTEVCENKSEPSAVAGGSSDLRLRNADFGLNSEQNPQSQIPNLQSNNPPTTAGGSDFTPPAIKPKQKTRLILFAVGFLSAVSLLLLLSFNFQSDAVNPNKVKSIAVLPVKSLTAENREPIYEFGIADSLILRLNSAKNLRVRPLSATRKYTDIEQDPLAVGREQQVDYLLASNYQLADGKIRITAQLFNIATGQIEETYKSEKEAGDIFATQDAIAGEMGKKLLARFATVSSSLGAKRGTTNEEAYRLYLQGKNLVMKRNATARKKAVEYFEQAVRLDPNYALAYAGLARAYPQSVLGDDGITLVENEKVKENIKKALELDNNVAEAYIARADLKLLVGWDFPAVERDLLHAIELEPNNDSAHWLYALLLAYRNRFDEAMVSIETAQAIDPGALMYMRDRGRILYYARRYDDAIVQFRRVIDLDEDFWTASNWLLLSYEMKGDHAGAYETFIKRQKQTNPDRVEVYQKAYETAGWQGVRRKQFEFLKLREHNSEISFFDAARLCAFLGEKAQAFEYLNKAVEKREWTIIMLKVDPPFDSLRDDARFDELVKRVGLK